MRISRFKAAHWIVLLLLVFLVGGAGCQKSAQEPAKKPATPAQLAPEVKKYGAEPTLSLYRTNTGAVQQIKLEEYIKGVVAGEIGPKFPPEALKAQAIIARTMTLALLEYENGTRGKHNTDVSDNHTEFQAYDPKAVNQAISDAVDATRGQVLTYQGKFVYALFHSASQNSTASIEEGFPKLKDKASYLVPVSTNGITKAPAKYQAWTVKVPRAQIKQIMGAKAGSLDDIQISEKGPSGRAMTIKAGDATIPAVDLRQSIGFDRLYSTQLSNITAEGSNIVFTGSGWGHGVGMDQWGAYDMAEKGSSARAIVEHYFPQTQWTQLYQ